jgi:aryl-alcohol dehydrogenase-like predicted oxidoreductase
MMGTSAAYGAALEEDDMFALLDKAREIGSRFWDTADSVFPILA